jgi:Regulator of chromosome condensation (RCC1) repeat
MGYFTTFVIKTDGSLWAWGRNFQGELGDGTTIGFDTPRQMFFLHLTALKTSILKAVGILILRDHFCVAEKRDEKRKFIRVFIPKENIFTAFVAQSFRQSINKI